MQEPDSILLYSTEFIKSSLTKPAERKQKILSKICCFPKDEGWNGERRKAL